MGDNPSSIDEHVALPSLATATAPHADSWRQGLRLEAVANLAHELRTPIQVLLGYVDILREDYTPAFSTETRAVLDRMNANVHELAQTVDNLMHFVLSEVNAEAMVDEDITPAGLVAEITPVLDAANQQKQLKVELDFASAPGLFRIPRRPLTAILLNLAVNAIKFTASGSVTIALRRRPDIAAVDAIEIEVSDTGPGLSASALNRAKEPFAQLSNSSTRHFRGMGLGLAVVQRSVDSLGGRIELRPHPDHGANFLVTIPVRTRETAIRAARAAKARRSVPMILPQTPATPGKPKIFR
ncbi:MAG TPA: HAMP domain-containing sensor histidine kinase [Candidatus Binataceae bacterium]|nr:HAMP domain-containing sensor histidine kinase [Candidatus Binataceae bacterium]